MFIFVQIIKFYLIKRLMSIMRFLGVNIIAVIVLDVLINRNIVGKNRLRVITDYGGVLAKKMAFKMETSEGKKEFAKRKETVEWPFGNIKQNMKYTEFLTRGLKQTITEKNLLNISHIIKRIYNSQNSVKIDFINLNT
ncbi:MAG: hypothetical protein A4E25_00285 [Methanobacterium sp. PtaB.Bin024]|nr:MAG: hypothetical protein A4E25_00285 [Methanobacterium sp. PtaB.Bin024]OPY24807.1 MAG: hypothetical protein A4E27_01149 [Methanobacterium sp. PtaU1.Bin242]